MAGKFIPPLRAEEYDKDYNLRTCKKCGRWQDWKVNYNHPTNRLIVTCGVCGFSYDMECADGSKVVRE